MSKHITTRSLTGRTFCSSAVYVTGALCGFERPTAIFPRHAASTARCRLRSSIGAWMSGTVEHAAPASSAAILKRQCARRRRVISFIATRPILTARASCTAHQSFGLKRLFRVIDECRRRGVRVVLSIDGTKKSGDKLCDVPIPKLPVRT